MQTRNARKMVLAAIVVMTAATGVGAGSAASARFGSSEAPAARIARAAASHAVARRVVSLGYDRRCGREAFAFKVRKRQSIPFC
jgi:hypothetical protein